jgi:DNA-binding NarL/FixJ family response regulator
MYGLTHCESQIGALLAKGTCLTDVAARLHVSINTVKTHLRGIYEKLGTSKQAQVVARLNHSSARLL